MERRIQLQLWVANDVDHRLEPTKLLRIIRETEAWMEWDNHEVEIEYQGKTIERYGVEIMEGVLALQPLQTNCLAQDRCGLPMLEETSNLTRTVEEAVPQPKSHAPVVGRCKPGSGCC
jgi:3-deoxy-D-manno-octulosonate 8-phosphate phosphatase KdsC-like HAD superfamily phosphatase